MADSPIDSVYGFVLVDHNRSARRAAVLSQALAEAAQSGWHNKMKEVKVTDVYTYRQPEIHAAIAQFSRSAVFIVVDENELTKLTDGRRLPRVPCQSIACGYELMNSLPGKADVYFVVRRNAIGLDVISILLSGARGVIDREVLGSTALIGMILLTLTNCDTQRLILAGCAAKVLDSIVQLIKSKHRMAKRHFALLVALAEIPLQRLEISERVTQKEVVNQVQRHFDETGYRVNLDTYRLLPTLLTMIKDEMSKEYDEDSDDEESDNSRFMLTKNERHELAFLPSYARNFGLPAHVLPIRGVDEQNLIRHIYKQGLYGIETLAVRQIEGVLIREVTLPLGKTDTVNRKGRKRRSK